MNAQDDSDEVTPHLDRGSATGERDGVDTNTPLESPSRVMVTAEGSEPPTSSTARRKWVAVVAVLALGIGCVTIAGWVSTRSEPEQNTDAQESTDETGSTDYPSWEEIRNQPLNPTAEATADAMTSESVGTSRSDEIPSLEGERLGDLFADAAFAGDYGVLDHTVFPEIGLEQPTTRANLDRWLVQGEAAQLHWAVRREETAAGTRPSLSWRAPVEPPPSWLLEDNGTDDSARQHDGSRVIISRRAVDGTWVEVTLEDAYESELVTWLDGLSSLPTAADVTAPPGFWEAPRATDFDVGYSVTYPEPTVIYVNTVKLNTDLSETEAELYLEASAQLGPPVADFHGPGTLYRFIRTDDTLVHGTEWGWQYGWVVNPRMVVLLWYDGALQQLDGARIAQALTLSSEQQVDDGSPSSLPPTPSFYSLGALRGPSSTDQLLNADTEVTNTRYGDLGGQRFAYFESVADDTLPHGAGCAVLIVGVDWSSAGCTPIDPVNENADGAVCSFRVYPARTGSGYQFALLVDGSIAHEVAVSLNGDTLTDNDMQVVTGSTGSHSWTMKSALLPGEPLVTADKARCTRLD